MALKFFTKFKEMKKEIKNTIKKVVSKNKQINVESKTVETPVDSSTIIKQVKKITSKKSQDIKSDTKQKPFKALIALPDGSVKEITNERQFNKLREVSEFRSNVLFLTRNLISLLKKNNFIGSWKINSNSIHFIQNRYKETSSTNSEEKEQFIRKYDLETLKPAFKKIKRFITKWDIYDTTLSSVISHDYRETNRESTKNKSWSAIGLDIIFKDSKFADIFIRHCLKQDIQIRGYSDIFINEK